MLQGSIMLTDENATTDVEDRPNESVFESRLQLFF